MSIGVKKMSDKIYCLECGQNEIAEALDHNLSVQVSPLFYDDDLNEVCEFNCGSEPKMRITYLK